MTLVISVILVLSGGLDEISAVPYFQTFLKLLTSVCFLQRHNIVYFVSEMDF